MSFQYVEIPDACKECPNLVKDECDGHLRAIGCMNWKNCHEQEKHKAMNIPKPTSHERNRIYIAGPMHGLPNFNYPKFSEVEALLAKNGWIVENPVKIGEKFGTPEQINASPELLCRVLNEELDVVRKCDAVFLLIGWHNSKGARREVENAINHQLDLYLEEREDKTERDPNLVGYIRSTINDAFDKYCRADEKFKRTSGALEIAVKENDAARAVVEKMGAEMNAAKNYIEGAKK